MGGVTDLEVLPNGEVIVLAIAEASAGAGLVKLTADGLLDTSFGDDGVVAISTFQSSEPECLRSLSNADLEVLNDGTILIAGASSNSQFNTCLLYTSPSPRD